MTAPERRRPLPALAFIGALCLLTALVWFRVLHRTDTGDTATKSGCPTASTSAVPSPVPLPTVLPAPSLVSVLVLNSTQRNGIAGAAKKRLERDGFKVTEAADDASALGGHGLIKGTAEIRYGPAALAAATLLRFYFPAAVMKATNTSSGVVTVSLGSKYRTPATSTVVRKALKKAHLTLSSKPLPVATPSATPSC
jgi:hypothetical protein